MSASTSPRLPYAAAIDGLRAIAVIAVIGYHLGISWMRGGFLGVDLFFVISGFLITRLLLGEHARTDRIALGDFWIRRFRRLVPPLVVVVLASVVATRLWGVPQQWSSMRGDALASLGYVANWRFVIDDVSYFETLVGPSPLRHIWSLAVEEQWYLLWPLVMAALAPWAARKNRLGVTTGMLLIAAAASATWMAVLYDPADLSRVYYGTDTRAQQLLVGAALGWITVAAPGWFSPDRLARQRVPFGLVLVGFVAAVVLVDDQSPWLYRGGLLALSVAGAVLVAGASLPGTDGPLGRLAARPLVAIGLRSYSLYLWHWPVIVFVGPLMGIDLSRVPLTVLRVVVSIALTEATYRWVEAPTRHSSQRPAKTLAVWTALAAVTAIGASTALATNLTALPETDVVRSAYIPPPPTTSPRVPRATVQPEVVGQLDDGSIPIVAPVATLPAPPAPPTPRFMLVGDSAATVLAIGRPDDVPAGWDMVQYGRIGCAITTGTPIDVAEDAPSGLYQTEACSAWEQDWTEMSDQFQPSVSLVMVGAWEVLDHVVDGRRLSFPSPEWTAHVDAGIRRGVAAASSGGGRVLLVRLPCMDQSTESWVSAQARNNPERVAAFNDILERIADEDAKVGTLPLDDLLCPGGVLLDEVDGEPVRSDGVHLTDPGAVLVWDWLDTQLDIELQNQLQTPTMEG